MPFDGNGLLNRRTGIYLYRGFESRPLRSPDDSSGQEMSKSAKNKGVTASKSDSNLTPNELSKVPVDDSTNTANVPNSDKLNNEPETSDLNLAEVVQAWPKLSKDIQSAILTLIRTTSGTTR